MPVKIGYGAGLPEMFDAKGAAPVAVHRPQPGQRRWMPVDNAKDDRVLWHVIQHPFDMAFGRVIAMFARRLCR